MCGADKHHPIAYIGGTICHEAWHLLRSHFSRAKTNAVLSEMQGYVWNIAADSEINDGLLEVFKLANVLNKLCLPDYAVLPSSNELPEGKLVEEYYYTLMDKMDQNRPQCSTCGGTGKKQGPKGKGKKDGDQQGQNQSGQGQSAKGAQNQRQQGHNHGDKGEPCPACHGTGKEASPYGNTDVSSGVDGLPREYEAGEPGPDNPISGLSEIESKMIRKEVARAIKESVKNRGNLPGGWKLWADGELESPKYNWRRELQKVVSRAIHSVPGDKYQSYKRLSRRCASLDYKVILPSHHNTVPTVAIVQDTSGSMGKDNFRISLEETQGILKESATRVKYINCDMAADKTQMVNKINQIDLYGGGGTDMRIGITAALQEKPTPDIIILFTDGWTPWPSERLPKGVQLVVCLVGQSACDTNEVPQWARVIKIVDDIVDQRNAVA
jgi:predicted metal-dependent peptidase